MGFVNTMDTLFGAGRVGLSVTKTPKKKHLKHGTNALHRLTRQTRKFAPIRFVITAKIIAMRVTVAHQMSGVMGRKASRVANFAFPKTVRQRSA